jgi:hypothetical protein
MMRRWALCSCEVEPSALSLELWGDSPLGFLLIWDGSLQPSAFSFELLGESPLGVVLM